MLTAATTLGLRAARIWAVTVAWSGVVTWDTRELRRALAWDSMAEWTADLMVGVRVTMICWTSDSF